MAEARTTISQGSIDGAISREKRFQENGQKGATKSACDKSISRWSEAAAATANQESSLQELSVFIQRALRAKRNDANASETMKAME